MEIHPEVQTHVYKKQAKFSTSRTFEPRGDHHFDYVFSHSILSHAPVWMLNKNFETLSRVLAPNGIALQSLRFSNEAGDLMGDSNDTEWVYPGVSFFSPETVARMANDHGLECYWIKSAKAYYTSMLPIERHDWIILWRSGSTHSLALLQSLSQAFWKQSFVAWGAL